MLFLSYSGFALQQSVQQLAGYKQTTGKAVRCRLFFAVDSLWFTGCSCTAVAVAYAGEWCKESAAVRAQVPEAVPADAQVSKHVKCQLDTGTAVGVLAAACCLTRQSLLLPCR
jgi:hypothetical protein